MFMISVTDLVALLLLPSLFGAVVGYVVAGDRMRRAAGGKTPAELREELDQYRAGVTAHFQQTADLLGGMTEQYRAVYTHMAKGAADLCESVDPGPRLEQLRSEWLDVKADLADEDAALRETDAGGSRDGSPAAPLSNGGGHPAPAAESRSAA